MCEQWKSLRVLVPPPPIILVVTVASLIVVVSVATSVAVVTVATPVVLMVITVVLMVVTVPALAARSWLFWVALVPATAVRLPVGGAVVLPRASSARVPPCGLLPLQRLGEAVVRLLELRHVEPHHVVHLRIHEKNS